MEALQLSWEGQVVPLGQQIHSLLPSPYTHRSHSCEQRAGFRQLERPGDGLMSEQESRNSQEDYRRGLVKDRISVLECCGVAPGPARIRGLKINKKNTLLLNCTAVKYCSQVREVNGAGAAAEVWRTHLRSRLSNNQRKLCIPTGFCSFTGPVVVLDKHC